MYDENKTVDAMRTGQVWAYKAIITRYYSRMMAMIRSMIYNEGDADMLAVHTFEDAFIEINRYRPTHKFSTWLFSIGRNNCIDYLRTKQSYVSINEHLLPFELSPEETMIAKERREAVCSAVEKLPAKYKYFIREHYFNGLQFDEISERNNINSSTARVIVMRGREQLKKHLNREI